MKKRWWAILLLTMILGLVGCGVETSSTTENNKKQEISQEAKEYKVGDTVDIKGMKLKVEEVKKSNGTEFDKPKDGNEFIIVKVAINNDKDKEISYNPLDYSLKNSEGQITDQAFTTVDSKTSLNSGKLSPGGKVSGTISFEAPKGDKDLTLLYKDNMFSDKVQAEIKLN